MATLTNEQVEQKLQQLKQLTEEVSTLTKELAEAGAIELSEEELTKVTGGCLPIDIKEPPAEHICHSDDFSCLHALPL